METTINRRLSLYIVLAVLTMSCAFLSRSQLVPLPVFISTYAGDTLWALMVFLCLCILASHWKTWKISIVAILISFVGEFSQFYHAPWIDSIRYTKLGGVILGFGFKLSDLVCYSIGIFFGAFIDHLLLKSNKVK
jgi:hypothetical protein